MTTATKESPAKPASRADAPASLASGIAQWDELRRQVALLLRESPPAAGWGAQARAIGARLQALTDRDMDMGIYLLIQQGGGEVDNYSSHHSLLCAVVCELCARGMGWSDDETESLRCAAITMNISIAALQDVLARQIAPLSESQRQAVDDHPEAGARMIQAAGVDNALWIDVVRAHGQEPAAQDDEPAALRLARLLRRVDVYTAKLSLRLGRHATSPSIAARDACLDSTGMPDAVGATMLRAIGLYPPGSFVLLANGEMAVCVRRGMRAHTPVVASLRRADGSLLPQPTRRDTSDPKLAIGRGLPAHEAKIRMNHLRVLGV